MNLHSIRATACLAAACLAAAPAAFAEPAATPPGARQPAARDARPDVEPGPGGPGGPGGPFHGPGRGGPGLPFLHGVALSEAQQDRLFAIMHEGAPQRREHDKAQRKAHEALRAAAGEDKFDEAKAAAAAQALGQAIAARELLRVRTEARAMALLTPQQRAALRQEGPARRPQ